MFKSLSLLAILSCAVVYCSAQQFRPAASSEVYRELNTLKHLPKVMYLAAHPDDENTGLLAWLIHNEQVETAYLSLTRGDGGQNLLGTEQGAALGLIRTHELLEARRLDGAQQFFTRAIDFGFSKNTKDTFKQWDADSITADVVWSIRKFRPDVIICRFPPTAAAGHGQHAASAVVAEKAFKAAADPKMFPNQLKYVKVWQVKRLLWNTFRFGDVNTTSENQLKVTVGQYDPQLGMGYGELAGLSRSLHKSQGAGTQSVAGIRSEYFTHVAGMPARSGLFDNVIKTWTEKGFPEVDEALTKLINAYNFNRPDLSIPGLLDLKKKIEAIKDPDFRKDKLEVLNHLILSCSGFMAELVTNKAEAVPGDEYNFRLNLISRSQSPVVLVSVDWLNKKESVNRNLSKDSLIMLEHRIKIPENAALTEPYWMAKPAKNAAQYSVAQDTLIGLPEADPELTVVVTLKIGAQMCAVKLPLSYKKLDPVKGDVVEPLRIVPALELKFTQPLYIIKENEDLHVSLQYKVNSNKEFHDGVVKLMYNGQYLDGANFTSINVKDLTINYTVSKAALSKLNLNQFRLDASYTCDHVEYTKSKVLIQYPHLPTLQYFVPSTTAVIRSDMQVRAKRVGYLPGAGDLIPDFLKEAGIQVDVLTGDDFYGNADDDRTSSAVTKLAQYDAIVMGVRINNTEKRLDSWMKFLMGYVRNGGNLIMQYNTLQDVTMSSPGIYPLTVANKRVTEEDAEVTFLASGSQLLNFPNKITKDDFKGWIQERGAYFPDKWDSRYIPLFEMHDTDEEPLTGSTLHLKYFKGNFIYTSLAFFRQLPAGNAGAAKLFFNFLSAAQN